MLLRRGGAGGLALVKVVRDADGEAEVVLRAGGAVGKFGADVVGFEGAQAEAAPEGNVQATADLGGKSVGGALRAGGSGEDAVKAVGHAEERLGENVTGMVSFGVDLRPARGVEGVARAGQEGNFVEVLIEGEIGFVFAGDIDGDADAAEEGGGAVDAAALQPETRAADGGDLGAL